MRTLTGTNNRDILKASKKWWQRWDNWTIKGLDGNDDIHGGKKGDYLYGEGGIDFIYGKDGSDNIYGGDDQDYLYGGDQNDYLYGGNGNDHLRGDNHNDTLNGGAGIDTLEGGSGNDLYVVYTNNDGVFEDRVIENAYSGYDTLETNADAIALPANVEKLVLKWTSWDGAIGVGNELNNSIHGGFYNDTLVGLDGMDNIYGGLGGDKIDGGDGLDFLYGEEGSDELLGGEGPDFLNGYSEGVNTNEFDTLTGGAGGDQFYLNYNNTSIAYMGNGYATITDFNPSESDKVVLVGEQGLYTTQGSDFDINIYRGTDLIGVVEDGLRVGFSMTDDVIYL